MLGDLRQELVNNIGTVKKDTMLTHKKRDEEARSTRGEFEQAHVKTIKEISSV